MLSGYCRERSCLIHARDRVVRTRVVVGDDSHHLNRRMRRIEVQLGGSHRGAGTVVNRNHVTVGHHNTTGRVQRMDQHWSTEV